MHEDVLAALVRGDEAEPVEEGERNDEIGYWALRNSCGEKDVEVQHDGDTIKDHCFHKNDDVDSFKAYRPNF